ncbi:hypothetical protein BDQ17DRAFT_1425225 [Cyathus striatus]|nr:hypothetical protein BDQ17DRAFT_1425225 [Cyathus striatus]
MAKFTDLPLETIREIARYVGYEDFSSLTLVCRYLTPVFQESLFSKIHLDHHPDRFRGLPAAYRFSSIAWNSPHLIPYIRSFSISLWSRRHEDLLVQVLSHGSNIRRLLISEAYTAGWDQYSSKTLAVLSSTLAKLPLAEVHLYCVTQFPLSLLTQCRSLRHLSLMDTYVEFKDLPLLGTGEQPIPLETLQLGLDSMTLPVITKWLLDPRCSLDIRHLKSLNLDSEHQYIKDFFGGTYFWEIMQRCSSSVETLRFNLSPPDTSSSIFDFSIFPVLRTLHIRTLIPGKEEAWIKSGFRNIRAENSLQTVVLDLTAREADLYSVTWLYDIFLQKYFANTSKIHITVFKSTPIVVEEIMDDFTDKGVDPNLTPYIKLNFCSEDVREKGFLKFDEGESKWEYRPEEDIEYVDVEYVEEPMLEKFVGPSLIVVFIIVQD